MVKLEICTGDPEGVVAAVKGGADRVELCSGLAEGGLTPSAGIIRFSADRIHTNVLIRPRAGDFVYSREELDLMAEDIRIAVENGAKGIVIGVLTPEGEVDAEACRYLLKRAEGLDNTFHRAFDVVVNPTRALETIIDLGFKRILTSGQSASAEAGASIIASLKKQAGTRISIMAGAGVTPLNVASLLNISDADEIHASARSLKKSAMKASGEATMGSADAADGSRLATDAETVAALRRAIDAKQKI